jgi:phosphofructokinase-like protein
MIASAIEPIRRVGILTGGGDCPGLNGVIRAVVVKGRELGFDCVGFRDGWKGVVEDNYIPLDIDVVRGVLPLGGTILGSSRTNPYAMEDGEARVHSTLRSAQVDALVAIGGDDTLGVAARLVDSGVRVVGVPKTIDNDLSGTEVTFGFSTAVQITTEAIDRLQTTAESHHRILICEVMGRHAGWIATYAGIAGGAADILIPEQPFDVRDVVARLQSRHDNGQHWAVIVIAEGALPREGSFSTISADQDAFGNARLGGIATWLAEQIETLTGYESRAAVLGHIQRGGTPTAFDRVLSTRFGVAAASAVQDRAWGQMVALQADQIVRIPMETAAGMSRTVGAELFDEVARPFFS